MAWSNWWTSRAMLFVMACAVSVMSHATAQGQTIAIIPGDQEMQAMVSAVRVVQQDAALQSMLEFRRLKFTVISQTLTSDKELQALAQADLVIARHMIGQPAVRMAATFKALTVRHAKLFGGGSNEGVGASLGLTEDPQLRAYLDAGGQENFVRLLRFVAQREFGLDISAEEPKQLPRTALWNPHSGSLHNTFAEFATGYAPSGAIKQATLPGQRPWVGLAVSRAQALSGSPGVAQAVTAALEARGFNVAPFFGFPPQLPIEQFLIDNNGKSHVSAIVAIGMKVGNVPEKIGPVLVRLDVPIVNAITLATSTRAEWEASPVGLDMHERSWQIAGPEFAGIVAPTVVATKERRTDAVTGLDYIAEVAVPERVARLADRVTRLVKLRTTLPSDKKVALIYYNSPPGNENVGASYLNVLPRSLWQILQRLEAEGYDTKGRPASEEALFDRLQEHGINIGSWAPGALSRLVAGGNAVLVPMTQYRRWFDALPRELRAHMVRAWGEPEEFKAMVWLDPAGQKHFVFPAQRYGNLLFAPQPARGWDDVKAQYHDTQLPPHHQYLAFYLWLQNSYQADAMVHVGTHGTHEWLSGKEVGFTDKDPSEVMVGAVPQIYPYIVDVVGEGLQAKRRGMATIISHMTPPFDAAGLNPELAALRGLLDDYTVALGRSESAAAATLVEINRLARKAGLLKNIGLDSVQRPENVDALQHHLEDTGQTQTPMGLHTFGVAPNAVQRLSTASAIVARQGSLSPSEREDRTTALAKALLDSGRAELDALVAALAGRYVQAGSGGDPLRNPASLPTGRNFYGFDPSRLPTPGVFAQGRELADAMLTDYKARHGAFPDRLLFTLWSNETMRHEGVLESQILYLMGVRPVWNGFGRITGLEAIGRAELGRPRVDVTITPSGLYRDALPTLMELLDQAVTLAKTQPETDNVIRDHVNTVQRTLESRGVEPGLAARIAAVRLFSLPPGAYGTGLGNVISHSNTWEDEAEVAETYFTRMGHLFGQGFWGDTPAGQLGGADDDIVAGDAFQFALKDVKAVLHSRASNLYGTLDNDDVFQFLGGAALAVRQAGGKTPETLLVNMGDPAKARTESLDQFMGREMQARYLNPKWINAMLREGYSGARAVMQVTQNLWGWQVTVPDAVDAAKWQAMFETYVQDRHQLGIREKFRQAKNMRAYQSMVDRMLVAVNKGYWTPDVETIAALHEANQSAIREGGVACHAADCSSEAVSQLAAEQDRDAMREARLLAAAAATSSQTTGFGLEGALPSVDRSLSPSPQTPQPPEKNPLPPPSASQIETVRGQEMREVKKTDTRVVEKLAWFYGAIVLLIVLLGAGFQAWRGHRAKRYAL